MPAKHLIGLGIGLSPNSTRFFITMGFGDADPVVNPGDGGLIVGASFSSRGPIDAETSSYSPMSVTNNSRDFASIKNRSR